MPTYNVSWSLPSGTQRSHHDPGYMVDATPVEVEAESPEEAGAKAIEAISGQGETVGSIDSIELKQ